MEHPPVKLILNILINHKFMQFEVKPEEGKQYEELGWIKGKIEGHAELWLSGTLDFKTEEEYQAYKNSRK